MRHSAAVDAAAIRLLVSARARRVVEEPSDGAAARRFDDRRCEKPEVILADAGAIPFDRYLEQRNREDRVEFSLGRGRCEPCPTRPAARGKQKGDEMVEGVRRGEETHRRGAAGWPRLGDVSPVAPETVQRRLETVYRVTVSPRPGGRIDLMG